MDYRPVKGVFLDLCDPATPFGTQQVDDSHSDSKGNDIKHYDNNIDKDYPCFGRVIIFSTAT